MKCAVTVREATRVGHKLGVSFRKFSPRDLARGMAVELEHGRKSPRTDVTHDDPIKTAKIALAHLNERPDYYDRLARIEKDAGCLPRRNPRGYSSGMSLARRSIRRRRSRRNPGPYAAGKGWYSFDTGNEYKYSGLTRKRAAHLLEKRAYAKEHGTKMPKLPRGHTWGDVAVVLHYGPERLRKKRAAAAARRRKKACACPVPRKRRVTAKRRPAPRKRRASPRKRALPAPRRRGPVDQLDFTRETFGR